MIIVVETIFSMKLGGCESHCGKLFLHDTQIDYLAPIGLVLFYFFINGLELYIAEFLVNPGNQDAFH